MEKNRTLIQELCGDIEENIYLQKLYNKLIKRYSRLLLKRTTILSDTEISEKEKNDLLRYANILSLSSGLLESGEHKVWAQQIVALLSLLFPDDQTIKSIKDLVLLNCTNYYVLKKSPADIPNSDVIDRFIQEAKYLSLRIPSFEDKHFYESQKEIYEGIDEPAISYSAPTSMGKSFLMRLFMVNKIKKGFRGNFALIVPTKALINELDQKILEEIDPFVKTMDYRVVKTPNDMVLEGDHNFVFIMTPERLFHLLVMKPYLNLDYIFIDEAHKISKNEGRTAFYYKIASMLLQRDKKPHFIFASPNIPNPKEYLKLANSKGKEFQSNYSPVSQIKYIINLETGKHYVYNDYSKEAIQIGNAVKKDTFIDIIEKIGNQRVDDGKEMVKNLIYCKSVYDAINYAKSYGDRCSYLNDPDLEKLSKDIANQIHEEYFLVDLIKKGVAYHVGYIPSNLRQRIEDQFVNGRLRFLFCTSTLIEGVNLPADNLFITSNKNGQGKFDKVSFQNLIGRVGRVDFNLFGNAFLIITEKAPKNLQDTYLNLLNEQVPEQTLSVDKLSQDEINGINKAIINKDFSFSNMQFKGEKLEAIRKLSLVLLDDAKSTESTPVKDRFMEFADDETKERIKDIAENTPTSKTLDITEDQSISLEDAIAIGAICYPLSTDPDSVYGFLRKLKTIFNWDTYEADDLGRGNSIRHFSYLVSGWMEGSGLSQIIKSSIWNIARNGTFWNRREHRPENYNPHDKMQMNLIIADTLYELENVVRFKISNYFREFTEKTKELDPDSLIDNDWYEYIEYGTKDPLIIELEKIGFTRETASHIKANKDKLLIIGEGNSLIDDFSLNSAEFDASKNDDLKKETKKIRTNLPELFK